MNKISIVRITCSKNASEIQCTNTFDIWRDIWCGFSTEKTYGWNRMVDSLKQVVCAANVQKTDDSSSVEGTSQ